MSFSCLYLNYVFVYLIFIGDEISICQSINISNCFLKESFDNDFSSAASTTCPSLFGDADEYRNSELFTCFYLASDISGDINCLDVNSDVSIPRSQHVDASYLFGSALVNKTNSTILSKSFTSIDIYDAYQYRNKYYPMDIDLHGYKQENDHPSDHVCNNTEIINSAYSNASVASSLIVEDISLLIVHPFAFTSARGHYTWNDIDDRILTYVQHASSNTHLTVLTFIPIEYGVGLKFQNVTFIDIIQWSTELDPKFEAYVPYFYYLLNEMGYHSTYEQYKAELLQLSALVPSLDLALMHFVETIIRKLKTFDVIIYSDSKWRDAAHCPKSTAPNAIPHCAVSYANVVRILSRFMKYAGKPRLIRHMGFYSQFNEKHHFYPSDSILVDSMWIPSTLWGKLQVGWQDVVAIPPHVMRMVDPIAEKGILGAKRKKSGCVVIGAISDGSRYSSPGLFLRLVRRFIRLSSCFQLDSVSMLDCQTDGSYLLVGDLKFRFLFILTDPKPTTFTSEFVELCGYLNKFEKEIGPDSMGFVRIIHGVLNPLFSAAQNLSGSSHFNLNACGAASMMDRGVLIDEVYSIDSTSSDPKESNGTGSSRYGRKDSCLSPDAMYTCDMLRLLRDIDIYVDLSPSYSINSYILPTLGALWGQKSRDGSVRDRGNSMGQQVYLFKKSFGREWSVNGLNVNLVEDTSVDAMTYAILNDTRGAVDGDSCGAGCKSRGFDLQPEWTSKSDELVSTLNEVVLSAYYKKAVETTPGIGLTAGARDAIMTFPNAQPLNNTLSAVELERMEGVAPMTSLLDVTQLRRKHMESPIVWPSSMLDEYCTSDRLGQSGYSDYQLVKTRMKQAPEGSGVKGYRNRRVRIFCGIFTIEPYVEELLGVLHTWGGQCDGFLAFSNITTLSNSSNPNQGLYGDTQSINIHTRGGESYHNMWSKTQNILQYIRRSVWFQDFDYFIMGGDDLLINIPNLRVFLSGVDKKYPNQPLYMGRTVRASYNFAYNTGGAGYILNKASVVVLTDSFDTWHPYCFVHERVSIEDVVLGLCLSAHNILPLDTTDRGKDADENPSMPGSDHPLGVERFHWHRPTVEYEAQHRLSLYQQYSINPQYGDACCSPYSVSFQYIESPLLMQCLHHAWTKNVS